MTNQSLGALYFSGLILISPACFSAENIRYVCQNGDQQRIIDVVYNGEQAVPCEVHYQRNGLSDVLWRAENEIGYCEQQAHDFVGKQQAWGWQCQLQPSALRPQAPTDLDAVF